MAEYVCTHSMVALITFVEMSVATTTGMTMIDTIVAIDTDVNAPAPQSVGAAHSPAERMSVVVITTITVVRGTMIVDLAMTRTAGGTIMTGIAVAGRREAIGIATTIVVPGVTMVGPAEGQGQRQGRIGPLFLLFFFQTWTRT
jgi:hypothetical protein